MDRGTRGTAILALGLSVIIVVCGVWLAVLIASFDQSPPPTPRAHVEAGEPSIAPWMPMPAEVPAEVSP